MVTPIIRWIEARAIDLLFLFASVGVLVTTLQSYAPEVSPVPGSETVDELPWLYDLCLAYIGAYVFHRLVVVIPAKKRQASRLLMLQMSLATIAHNGMDLMRDLEKIACCPAYRITEEHLQKVLTACNDNPHIRLHIAERLSRSRSAYQDIVPFAHDLPLDLQEALQNENQNFIYSSFGNVALSNKRRPSIDQLREGEPIRHLLGGGKFEWRRQHLGIWYTTFMQYYEAAERVRCAVDKHMPQGFENAIGAGVAPGRFVYIFGPEFYQGNPYYSYPASATSVVVPEPTSPNSEKPADVSGTSAWLGEASRL